MTVSTQLPELHNIIHLREAFGLMTFFFSSLRYDIRIYPTFLHLHGKTFDYKIPYTTVLRLFLLPHKDQRQMFFVVSEFFCLPFSQIV